RDDAVVISEPQYIEVLRTWIFGHRAFAKRDGFTLITDQMVRDAEHPLDIQRACGIVQDLGDRDTSFADTERTTKISYPGEVDVKAAQQPKLPMQILERLRKVQAAREGGSDRFCISLRKHHRYAMSGQQLHLLTGSDRCALKRPERQL